MALSRSWGPFSWPLSHTTRRKQESSMNPLEEALYHCAEYGGGPKITFEADWDATIILGSPGLFDGLVIASWVR
ncbi:hypothetical protein CKJ61_07520 [Mycobacterium intracellulare]|nr:hypothetical protein CKJ61_07520 [Mycobacterium intracellulare]